MSKKSLTIRLLKGQSCDCCAFLIVREQHKEYCGWRQHSREATIPKLRICGKFLNKSESRIYKNKSITIKRPYLQWQTEDLKKQWAATIKTKKSNIKQ
jgi:hypothetical protein